MRVKFCFAPAKASRSPTVGKINHIGGGTRYLDSMPKHDHRADNFTRTKSVEPNAAREDNLEVLPLSAMRGQAVEDATAAVARQLNGPMTALMLYMNERKQQSHQFSQAPGNRLYLHSPAVVSMQSGSSFWKAVRHSYHGGRVYGARRPVKGMRRLIYGCGSVLLPLILPVRVLARAMARRRDRMRIIASSLHLVVLTTFWSLGEMLGYFLGEGESAHHWR